MQSQEMAPLGLLAKSLARHPGIFMSTTPHCGIRILPKKKVWRHEYENTSRIMGLMRKAAPFPGPQCSMAEFESSHLY